MTRACLLVAGALLALVSGCSPALSDTSGQTAPAESSEVPQLHPESGLEVIPLVVRSARQSHAFRVERAVNRFDQAQGLMFRRSMAPDEGMLFPFERPRRASFWMRNTVIPLDIIFIGADGRILNIAANTVPYSETPILSQGEAVAVLELNGGRSARLGIEAGDKVEWQGSKPLASDAGGR